MGRLFYLAAALAAAGCGNVGASAADAAIDALPDALSCSATQNACASGCSDPMNDSMNCGACGNACQATNETCTAGHCVDPNISCFSLNTSGKPTGLYTLDDGSMVYCDMSVPKGYTSLVMGPYNILPAGYTMISAADLQNSVEQDAFIALYNQQTGMKVLAAFGVSGDNCCFKQDNTATSNMLFLEAGDVYPAVNGVRACTPPGGYVTTNLYSFNVLPDTGAGQSFATPPLPPDFFTMHPATSTVGCSVLNNPAIFWKVTQ